MPHSRERIETDLRKAPLGEGDAVALHVSYKSLGGVEGGPGGFVGALLTVVGESGTLMAPTFTYNCVGRPGVTPFTLDSPSVLCGIVSETVRKHPGAKRSAHPTHSIAAIGKHADRLAAANRVENPPLGKGSPFHLLAQMDGKILLLGATHVANSSLHLAESLSGVEYRNIPFREFWGREALVMGENGKPARVRLAEDFPGCSKSFDVVSGPLQAAGIEKRVTVGDAECLLLKARPMLEVVIGMIREQPDVLLCSDITCEPCALRRRKLKEIGRI